MTDREFAKKFKTKKTRKQKKSITKWQNDYRKQLRNPLWLKRRLEILDRDNNKCVKCGSTSKLRVHHLAYRGKAWEAYDSELTTLCKVCHDIEHGLKKNSTEKKFEELKRAMKAKRYKDVDIDILIMVVNMGTIYNSKGSKIELESYK